MNSPFDSDANNSIARVDTVIALQNMANSGKTPSDMLRYLVLELKIEQQLELMKLFAEAFDVSLGEVTAISGWWHDESAEMNDNDINHYIASIIEDYLEK